MLLKRVTCASAIAIGVGVSALTAGVGLAAAQPGPPPCGPQGGTCQGPGGRGGRVDRVDRVGRIPAGPRWTGWTRWASGWTWRRPRWPLSPQADLTTAAADRAAPVGPATGVVDRAGQVTGAMVPVARVGRTGVPHPRTSPGVGSIRVGTTTSHSTGMAAGCSPCSTPTSTTGAFGSLASGFRCDGLANSENDVRPVMVTSPAAFRFASASPSGQIRGGFCVSDAIGGHSPGCDGRPRSS